MTRHKLLKRLAPDLAELIFQGEPREPAARERKIFVNRQLRMEAIRSIGFDMDYTLAVYRPEPIEQLQFHMTQERLVADRSYPEAILKIPYDRTQVLRGLVVDSKLGNLLKLDAHHLVCRVSHGQKHLSEKQRQQLYRSRRVTLSGHRYISLDTQFAIPEVALFSALVDFFDQRRDAKQSLQPVEEQGGRVSYGKIFADVRACIDRLHDDGSLKSHIVSQLPRFIDRDPLLPATLQKLRDAGKRLFLLTNSGWSFTDQVMRFLLETEPSHAKTWRDFFDVIVVDAGKPRFFSRGEHFLVLDENGQTRGTLTSGRFVPGQVYARGNLRDFEHLAQAYGDSVLYVGDHIYGDILRSKKDSMWRTALITADLEQEVAKLDEIRPTLHKLTQVDQQRASLDDATNNLQSLVPQIEATLRRARENKRPHLSAIELRRLDDLLQQIHDDIDAHKIELNQLSQQSESTLAQIEASFNPNWGRVLKEGYELSRYGAQVKDFACIYTSRVTNFIYYSPLQEFRAQLDRMAHEPSVLQHNVEMTTGDLTNGTKIERT